MTSEEFADWYGSTDKEPSYQETWDAAQHALIAKLAAGVSVEPEVMGQYTYGRLRGDVVGYTKKDFNTAIAASRVQAIGECANLVEEMSLEDLPDEPTNEGVFQICTGVVWANKIRALIGKEST